MPNAVNKNLRDLTTGERFWLVRTHYKWTQKEAAAELGVSERAYNHIERDMKDAPKRPARGIKFSPGLLCALARRRDGRNLRQLAKILKTGSHVTLLARERDNHPALVKAWEAQGYSF